MLSSMRAPGAAWSAARAVGEYAAPHRTVTHLPASAAAGSSSRTSASASSSACSGSTARRAFRTAASQWDRAAAAAAVAGGERADGHVRREQPSQRRPRISSSSSPSSAGPGSTTASSVNATDSESIYPSSQAALRPNPYARAPLYRHSRASPNQLRERDGPQGIVEPPEIARLNEALRLAVARGAEESIDSILSKLAQIELPDASDRKSILPSTKPRGTTTAAALPSGLLPPPLLSTSFTKNWTPLTYHHMLTHCVNTSRAEFALAIFAAAYQHAGGSLQALPSVFPHSACGSLVRVLVNVGEARIAQEVAKWLNSGEAPLVKRSHWLPILNICARNAYLPGIIDAWNRTMKNDVDLIDEGLLLQILSAAARNGDVDFCIKVLRRAISGNIPTNNIAQLVLHQGLLAPVFEAFCASFQFEAAIRFISRMQAAGMDFKRHATTPLSSAIWLALSQKDGSGKAPRTVTEEIKTALRNVGSAYVESNLHNPLAGVHVSAFNAVIVGAAWAKQLAFAEEIYKLRSELLGIEMGTARLFTLDEFLQDAAPATGSHSPSSPDDIADQLNRRRLLPDLDTFHALISACTDAGQIRLARQLLQDLNGYSLEPSAETYQRLVKLCLACAPRVYEQRMEDAARASVQAEEERKSFADRPFGAETQAATAAAAAAAAAAARRSSPSAPAPGAGGSDPRYEDAFKLLEECKKRDLRPTQATYEAIVWRCWRERDERWLETYREMRYEAGYVPSMDLLVSLQPGLKAEQERREEERWSRADRHKNGFPSLSGSGGLERERRFGRG